VLGNAKYLEFNDIVAPDAVGYVLFITTHRFCDPVAVGNLNSLP